MKEILFFTELNESISNVDLLNSLKSIGSNDADILYIHSALNFGAPNTALKKKDLLNIIFETLIDLRVSTMIFPTYTFSFCNGDNFNVQETKTPMGILNEYVRKQPVAIRSIDPLMSNVLIGENHDLVKKIGKNSIGEESTFDHLHNTPLKVKFLFLGPAIGDCFTYMHFIEERLKIPYRYTRDFTGIITDQSQSYEDTYKLFVRYNNVIPGAGSYIYENMLLERGHAKKMKLGNSHVSITDENSSYSTYVELISKYPNFFLKEPFVKQKALKDFFMKNMVSL